MSDEVKPEVIKKTQDALSKYIKKPQLTEKLLKKPPFRFLHDIVTNVIKETGFLHGLFTEEELNHENIKDREGKVAFLDKLINCVKLATGSQLAVRSTKVVAGLEPTRTNELLQAIGQALAKKVNSSQAVQEVLKKSPKKAGASESKKKEKPSEAKGAAPKQETSRRDRKDVSTTREPKAEKKDPSSNVKGPSRVQDKKSEKQDGAVDTKKRSLKEKEAVKSSSKPGKTAKEERVDKSHIKSSKTVKQELENKVDDSVPNVTEKLVRRDSENDKKKTTGNEPLPEGKNLTVELPGLTEKPFVVQEQHSDEDALAVNDPTPNESAKATTERQRPLSALGRKRSAAVSASKQQRSSEEKVEPATTLPSSSEPEDKTNVTKADTPAPIPPTPTPSTRPPSSVPGTSRASLDNQVSNSTPIPLVRPRTAARQGSARPGAPRLRNRGEVALVSEEQVKPVAVNLIVEAEGVKEDQDEDENLVVLENTTTEPAATNIPRPDSGNARPSSGQGHLVAQILETQKELEARSKVLGVAASQAENSSHKVEIDWEASRQRERGTALREVERLCESIQTVTRAAHPIGKLFDSLQEDVESMQQELEHWQSMQRSLEEQLLAEEALSVQSTQPLKDHLQQLQQAVLAQQDQLRISKANILANDQRIHKILAGGDSTQQSIFSR